MITRRFGPRDLQLPIVGRGTWHLKLTERERSDIQSIDEAFPLGPPRSVIPTI